MTTDNEAVSADAVPPPRRRRRLVILGVVAVVAVAGISTAVATSSGSRHSSPSSSPARGSSGTGPDATGPGVTAGSATGSEPVPPGFPSAISTGVPADIHLTAYTGSTTITKAGTVISGVLVTGCLVIKANNVTVRDSKVVCRQKHAGIYLNSDVTGGLISHVEVDGMQMASVGIQIKNAVVDAVNVHGSGDGIHLGQNATLENSYVHDLGNQHGLHHDDLQTLAGSTASHITVMHNTLQAYIPGRQDNTVYHMGSGAISDVQVTDNFMDGGHYTVEVDNGPTQHDIVFRDNHFGRHYHWDLIGFSKKGDAVTLVGNVWQDDGRPATQANSRLAGVGSLISPSMA